jgi:uncharacterized low-complexity protein
MSHRTNGPAGPAACPNEYLENIMKFRTHRAAVAALAGSALLTTLGFAAPSHAEVDDLFAATDLAGGYLLATKDDAEGKCGEGKCGGETKDGAEGKCGEGKCGGDEGKDDAEGKCGEGKCGGAA